MFANDMDVHLTASCWLRVPPQAYAGELDGHHEAGRGDGSDKMVRGTRACSQLRATVNMHLSACLVIFFGYAAGLRG